MSVLTLNPIGGGGDGGVTDHGALTGLVPDDDHTQYLLLAGRAGGQVAFGGTGAGDNLSLQSTTNATRGNILLGISSLYQDDLSAFGPRLGIGTLTPSEPIHADWNIDGNVAVRMQNHNTGPLAVARFIADVDVGACFLTAYGSGFVSVGARQASGGAVVANNNLSGGLSLVARAGDLRIYSGGNTDNEERLRFQTGGVIVSNSPFIFNSVAALGQQYVFDYNATESYTSNFIGGGLNMSGTITFSNPTFIYESFRGAPTINSAASPGFAAYTVLQALPLLRAGAAAGQNPLQALCLNAGPTVQNAFAGTKTVSAVAAVNFAGTLNGALNGAVLNCTNWTGITVRPQWNTVAGSTIDFGTVRGVYAQNPGQAIFGQSLGVERLVAYYGLDVQDITLNNATANAPRVAVRSAMNAGTNKLFLQNTGTANSDFGNSDILFNDAGAVVFGTDADVRIEWDNAAGAWKWNPAVGEDLGIAFGIVSGKPTYLFEAETFGDSEINYTQIRFGFDRFAFGQTAAIGNQVGVWTAGPRTVEVAGGWSDYLLTQGGSLTIPNSFSMSDMAAWTINAISLANPATSPQPSIASLDTFVVGAMTTSNPGVAVTERSAVRVTGRTKLRGSVQYPPITPSALSAGDNNDWAGLLTNSPNNNTRFWGRVTGNVTTSVITGIDATAVQDGDTFELTNVGTENILIENQGTGSAASNRIITGQGSSIAPNFVLSADRSMALRYDGTSSRWRVITPPGAVAPLSGHWRFDTTTTMADPGSGAFRNNNGTLASVTAVAISDISFRGGDASAILSALASGDQLYIQNESDAAEFMVFNITSVTDNTTWFQINGTAGDVGNAFSNNNEFNVIAIFA